MLNEPNDVNERRAFCCGKWRSPQEIIPGTATDKDGNKRDVELCTVCFPEDEHENQDQDEGKTQDEIFGDDCDTGYRMEQARTFK